VYGVLKLTLSDGSYSWQLIPVGGSGPTDSRTGACHWATRARQRGAATRA